MLDAVLLMTAILAADPAPAQVTGKVLYGTSDESQKAEIEDWIGKTVAEGGSPIAVPYTGWIVLTGDEQELHASMRGGRLIKGKVSVKDGGFDVEIGGFKIGDLKRTVTLKPGDRRVIKLTDYPPLNNVFIALAAEALAEDSIAVTVVGTLRTGIAAIGGETTGTTITAKGVTWELDFGKDAELRKAAERLDGKKVTVRGTLERRAGVEVKERWIVSVAELQAAGADGVGGIGKPSLHATIGREDSHIRFFTEGAATVVDVTSASGIDKATIERMSDAWPKVIVIRLHLSGLESFKVFGKDVAVEWSVSSTGEHEARSSLVSGKRVAALTKDSPAARLVLAGAGGGLPLRVVCGDLANASAVAPADARNGATPGGACRGCHGRAARISASSAIHQRRTPVATYRPARRIAAPKR